MEANRDNLQESSEDRREYNVQLSKRLQQAVNFVTKGYRVADVGCDHGFVSIWLVQQQISPNVIAMDVRKGPLAAAKEHVEAAGLVPYITLRLSDGVEKLQPGEVDCLFLAGMGGPLMLRILEQGAEKIETMQELVLQPQSEIPLVRRTLRAWGFAIVEEEMVLEDGKYYPMFRVLTQRGQETIQGGKLKSEPVPEPVPEEEVAQQLFDTYGKILLQKKHPVLRSFLQKELRTCEQIRASVQAHAAEGADREARLEEVEQRIHLAQFALRMIET